MKHYLILISAGLLESKKHSKIKENIIDLLNMITLLKNINKKQSLEAFGNKIKLTG